MARCFSECSISTADGSALVRLGDTTVVCGIKAEVAEPDLDLPGEGFLVPNFDLPAICSPKFKPGPPTEEAQVLSNRLNEALVASGVVPLSSLCIHPGKSVLMAMVAALKNTRLPQATFDEESGRTMCSRKIKTPLQITRTPISMSFGIFNSTHILADPTSLEEPLLDTTFSVITDEHGDMISVTQLGLGSSDAGDTLTHCITEAKKRRSYLQKQGFIQP